MNDLCEWNPFKGEPATEQKSLGLRWGCDRPATLSVGVRSNWHLCDECAALPRFKRMTHRLKLSRGR